METATATPIPIAFYPMTAPRPTLNLTEKEATLLEAIRRGMDAPNSGWLHDLAPGTLSTAGVLGSLVKKGLVRSVRVVEKSMPDAFWVEIIDA